MITNTKNTLTREEWKARELKTGKSVAIMKILEHEVAKCGDEALTVWHFKNGLRNIKPRYRVKARSAPISGAVS